MADVEVIREGDDWVRVTEDEDLLGCSAGPYGGGRWSWSVDVAAAEFVREDPLESRFVGEIEAALRGVPGVTEVVHEDREVWLVGGAPSGEGLVRAVSAALDRLAPEIQAVLDDLG